MRLRSECSPLPSAQSRARPSFTQCHTCEPMVWGASCGKSGDATQRALPIMLIRRLCSSPLYAIHRVFTRQLTLPHATRAHAAQPHPAGRAHAAQQDERASSTSSTVIPLHSTPLPSRSRDRGLEVADETTTAATAAVPSVSVSWDFPPPDRWGSDDLLMSG